MDGGRVDQAVFRAYGETLVGGGAGVNAGASYSVDLSQGNAFNLILNSPFCTLTFANPAVASLTSFTLILQQDATANKQVVWPASVIWQAGQSNTLTNIPNRFDIFVFTTMNAGTTWYGFAGGKNYS